MQFYVNGYRPGDPLIEDGPDRHTAGPRELPDEVDVLIVGCGPAGLVLAAQLARFPDIETAVIDRRDGPLEVGQADGVACRTVEMFETFGLARRLIEEAYWVNEVCFWQPDPLDARKIRRAGRIRDTDEELSEFPHVIVNQARMQAYLLEFMERSATRLSPFYGLHASAVTIDEDSTSVYPVSVTLRHLQAGEETGACSTVRAKYVVGCDGARSAVRTAIGRELVGDMTNVSWGVMDVLTSTDFPDIRIKCTIQSAKHGSIVLIPREGGYLARFYIELDPERHAEMLESRSVTPERLTAVANEILHPYSIDVRHVGWWSVYEVGQRLCEKFDDVPAEEVHVRHPRVFIAGDACHTHSAKAGQGMNVSMADTFNLGWKLSAVIRGIARPEVLHTYSEERREVARELIDFDKEWSAMLSLPPKSPDDPDAPGVDPAEFQRYFVQSGRFTAGVATRYQPSTLVASAPEQGLAAGFPVGMRFHSAPVVRLADAKRVQLGHVARADGAWRLYIFADADDDSPVSARVAALCEFLQSKQSPVVRFTPGGAEPDSVIDVRAVFQRGHREMEISDLPPVLLPRKGRFGIVDYEKAYCPDPLASDIFDQRGVDRERGCMVLVRPDQFVSHVLALDDHDGLASFFDGILIKQWSDSRAPVVTAAVAGAD